MTITRRKTLVGVLAIVLVVWLIDALGGSKGPATAKARSAAGASQVSSPAAPGGARPMLAADVALPADDTAAPRARAPISPELDQLDRDLFVPTPAMAAALDEVSAPPEEPAPASAPAAPEAPFENRHSLQGVILGPRPLAVVDGRLLPVGTQIDGHTLVRIERDTATFRDGSTEVVLKLTLPAGQVAP
jgi:hypothetical protein